MQLGNSFKTALQKLRPNRNVAPLLQPVDVIEPIAAKDHDQWTKEVRQKVLMQQGMYFRQQTMVVMAQAKIPVSQIGRLTIGPRYMSVPIRLADATQLKKAISMADAVGYAAKLGDGTAEPPVLGVPIAGWLHYQFQLPRSVVVKGEKITLWQDVFINDPRLKGYGVGVGADNKAVEFSWEDAPHALIAATTDGGKSTLVAAILYTLTHQYTPDQLRIGIIDPKRDYENFRGLPHLIAPVANRAGDITEMLKYFAWETFERVEHGHADRPRWLLVMDEADANHVLGTPLNEQYALFVGNQGRGERVNMIVSTHKPDAASIGAVRETADNRFLGKVTNSATSGQLGAGLGLHKLSSRGDFLHVARGRQYRFLGARVPHRLLTELPNVEPPNYPMVLAQWQLPGYVEPKNPGRPRIELEPKTLAKYLFYGERLTPGIANRQWQITPLIHTRYKEFAQEVFTEYNALEESGPNL